jgi:3',5'-cyclic-AMP phosphodiesterase
VIELEQNAASLQKIQALESQMGNDFKIAFIADTHNYYQDLQEQIQAINRHGPYRFVILVGDATNHGLLEEYHKTKEYLDKLSAPYLVAVGNHDLLSNGKAIYKKLFGPKDFSFVYKDAEFIIFDNNNWENGGTVPNLMFIEAQLLASVSPHKILVAHVSPTDRDRFDQAEQDRWINLINQHGVAYFINGHNHNPTEYGLGSARQLTVGASNKRVYLELIFSAAGVTHKKISF